MFGSVHENIFQHARVLAPAFKCESGGIASYAFLRVIRCKVFSVPPSWTVFHGHRPKDRDVNALGIPAGLENPGKQPSTVERETSLYGTLAITFEADDSARTGNLIWFLFTGIATTHFSYAVWPPECVRGNEGYRTQRTRASRAPAVKAR